MNVCVHDCVYKFVVAGLGCIFYDIALLKQCIGISTVTVPRVVLLRTQQTVMLFSDGFGFVFFDICLHAGLLYISVCS